MQIIFQRRKAIDVTLTGGGRKCTDRHLADASIWSCDPRACLTCNWRDVGFGTVEVWLDGQGVTNERTAGGTMEEAQLYIRFSNRTGSATTTSPLGGGVEGAHQSDVPTT